MGSGGVGASARTGNHFHLSCDSSEWSMMLRPLTTSVVLFMESTFFYFRVTISGKLCHKLPPPAFGGGGSCSEVVFCQQLYEPSSCLSAGATVADSSGPHHVDPGPCTKRGRFLPNPQDICRAATRCSPRRRGTGTNTGRMRRNGQEFATSSCLPGQNAKVCRQDRGRAAPESPKI